MPFKFALLFKMWYVCLFFKFVKFGDTIHLQVKHWNFTTLLLQQTFKYEVIKLHNFLQYVFQLFEERTFHQKIIKFSLLHINVKVFSLMQVQCENINNATKSSFLVFTQLETKAKDGAISMEMRRQIVINLKVPFSTDFLLHISVTSCECENI